MPELMEKLGWRDAAAAGRPLCTGRLGRNGRIAAHLLGWPLLVKVGLLSGFALAAAVQHLLVA